MFTHRSSKEINLYVHTYKYIYMNNGWARASASQTMKLINAYSIVMKNIQTEYFVIQVIILILRKVA